MDIVCCVIVWGGRDVRGDDDIRGGGGVGDVH